MTQPIAPPTLVIIGGNSSFNYLIQRYAERNKYSITAMPVSVSKDVISALPPVAVIFPSLEGLEESQLLADELVDGNIPIIVCSSVADQIRARELGADFCLLHPFGYDSFSTILENIAAQSGSRLGDGE